MSSVVKRPRILILSGSIRVPSYTRTLSQEVARVLVLSGASVVHWDAQNPVLPIADPEYHKSAWEYPDPSVRQLDSDARTADAFVFATPVYHNSYSGVLKNTIDLLNIEPHFRAKPVGLVSYGGDKSPQAVDHLRIVVRGLNAIATATHVCTQRTDFEDNGDEYRVTNDGILQRIQRFSDELLTLAVVLRPLRSPDAVQRLLGAIASAED